MPKDTSVYSTSTLDLDLDKLTGTTLENAYNSIENDLKTYTNTYRNGTSYSDIYSSETGLTESQYYTLKKKMLKSVFKNGGFYVGRYETGIDYSEGARTIPSEDITQIPVIKQNAYPYNFITNKQAQLLAYQMSQNGCISSLMFGVQWDLILKYLETKGTSQYDLNSDSTSWGNYKNSKYNIANTNAKHNEIDESNWTLKGWKNAPYNKTDGLTILTTGAIDTFKKYEIYDLAGNLSEWTLEYTYDSNYPCTIRGGDIYYNGGSNPASGRYGGNDETRWNAGTGFRIVLYTDEIV